MNSLALSLVVISSTKPLPTSPGQQCSAKLILKPFRGLQNIFSFTYSIDKGGNSLPLYLPHDKPLQAPPPDPPIPKRRWNLEPGPSCGIVSDHCAGYCTYFRACVSLRIHFMMSNLGIWIYKYFEPYVQLTDILNANSKRCKIWNIDC